ncbi:Na+/H+ antiporter NhaC family protein, partial [Halorubrum ezzemoulense]|nr:Na+/H+ antiporter NhaC family protein [Halorubrum ezzemoulense]
MTETRDGAPPATDGGDPPDGSEFGVDDDASNGPRIEFRGGKWASTVPLVFFICWAIFQSGVLGIGDTNGLVAGALVGTTLGMFLVRGDWKAYADTIFEGM